MSWSRTELKYKAREFLNNSYWETFLVTLIFAIISGSINFEYDVDNYEILNMSHPVFIAFVLVGVLVKIFAVNVLKVGMAKFFTEGEKGNVEVSNIFSMFKCKNYFNIIKTMFLRDLYVFLWSLLFIIPGIIKTYEYEFISYVLIENPNMSSHEIFKKAKYITDNQKMDMFILDLSFFGWYLLGALIIIGAIFVAPYHQATNAQLYFKLRNNY